MAVILFTLLVLALFLFGVLVGHGFTTSAQDACDRRQANRQQYLNDQLRILKDNQEEFLRWRYKQQAGLRIYDYKAIDRG